jgi:hypothetical protein
LHAATPAPRAPAQISTGDAKGRQQPLSPFVISAKAKCALGLAPLKAHAAQWIERLVGALRYVRDTDTALAQVINQRVSQCRLAGTGRTNQSYPLAGVNFQ